MCEFLRRWEYRLGFVLVLVASACTAALAEEASALLVWKGKEAYISQYPAGTVTQLLDGNFESVCLSPDGKKIAYFRDDSLFTMNNDGTGETSLIYEDSLNYNHGKLYWSTNGFIYLPEKSQWGGDGNVHLYNPSTGSQRIIVTTSDLGEKCDYWRATFQASADGKRMWLGDLDAHDVDSMYCGVRGYSRGGHPYVHFNDDFTDYDVVWRTEWGHGRTMSADGTLFLVGISGEAYHRDLWVTKQHEDSLETIYGDYGLKPPYTNHARPIAQCINNDSILASDVALENGSRHSIFWNWKTAEPESLGIFTRPDCGDCDLRTRQVWYGALPDPHDNQVYVVIDKQELVFTAQGASGTISKELSAQNVTVGVSLSSALEASVAPADPDWLDVAIDGSGNTQTVTTEVHTDNLPDADSTLSVRVSLSNSQTSNTASYKVTVYTGDALPAPTSLTVSDTGDSLLDATVQWTDNAAQESGYIIQRRVKNGTWDEVARTGADEESYIDEVLGYHTTYEYRVCAYKDLDGSDIQKSAFSTTAQVTIEGIPWIRMHNPTEGQKVEGPSRHYVRWSANNVSQIKVMLSFDGGLTFTEITDSGGISTGNDYWGNFPWSVPDTQSQTAILKVVDYQDPDNMASSGLFHIGAETLKGRPLPDGFLRTMLLLEDSAHAPFLPYEDSAEIEQAYTGSDMQTPSSGRNLVIDQDTLTWRLRTTNDSSTRDNELIWYWFSKKKQKEDFIAYWFVTIYSPRQQTVRFNYTFNNALTVWRNGEKVIDSSFSGGGDIDPVLSPQFELSQGKNSFLFRLREESNDNWFAAQFTDASGNPLDSLYYDIGFGDSAMSVSTGWETSLRPGRTGISKYIRVHTSRNELSLDIGRSGVYNAALFNAYGACIQQRAIIGPGSLLLPLGNTGNGIYILRVDHRGERMIRRICIPQ